MRCLAALHYAWVRASDLSATLWAFFSLAPLSSDDRAYQRAGNAALKKRPTQKEINEPCDGWTSERANEGGREGGRVILAPLHALKRPSYGGNGAANKKTRTARQAGERDNYIHAAPSLVRSTSGGGGGELRRCAAAAAPRNG